MSEQFKAGDWVRVKATGAVVQLDWVNDNPNYKADDEFWAYTLSTTTIGTLDFDDPSEVEKISDPTPTQEEFVAAVAQALMGSSGDLEIHETMHDSRHEIHVDARWKGLSGGFVVSVTYFDTEMG